MQTHKAKIIIIVLLGFFVFFFSNNFGLIDVEKTSIITDIYLKYIFTNAAKCDKM